jgi:SAM-dependent methyltransferase
VDISGRTVEHLGKIYPDYKFVTADVTESLPEIVKALGPFDVITVFDVLYHIVDDLRVDAAVENIAALIAADGQLLIMDQLCKRDYQVSKHVKYRNRDAYLSMFDRRNLVLQDSELLFHFLVPPITGVRVADFLAAAVFKVFGLLLRVSDGFAAWSASKLRHLDSRLRMKGVTVPNCEFFVFASDVNTDV